MKWFKFYGQDYLCDPKILSLSSSERSCWITLLAYVSVNDNGKITFMDEQRLMLQAGIDPTSEEWNKALGILDKFKSLQMIQVDNNMITIVNWHKRQDQNLTPYERVKRYREKKKHNDNLNDNNRLDKIRLDKNILTSPSASVLPSPEDSDIPFSSVGEEETLTKKTDLRKWYRKVLYKAAELRTQAEGKPFIFIRAQSQQKALKQMNEAGIKGEVILGKWNELCNDDKWLERGFDMHTIAYLLDKKR